MSIYLDYNASSPIDPRVLEVMNGVYINKYGNADSRTHDYGTNAKNVITNARNQVADLLGISSNEVIFTSGATESNNIAILGLNEYAEETNRKHIVTTAIEHKAVLEPIRHLEKNGYSVDYVSPDASGRIDVKKLLEKVKDDTLLVSVMHVNNETGIIQPVIEIGEALYKNKTLFHIDAAQSCGKLVEELQCIKYDMLSITAHKMYGPQGIGALILRRRNYKTPPVKPIMFGGSHERGFRPGTLAVALIAGFGKACELAGKEYKNNNAKHFKTKQAILSEVKESNLPYTINGDEKYCMPNTLNISFIGVDSEALMLSTKQYCSISNGSACTSRDYTHSHVLSSMGLTEDVIESAVRMSWGGESKIDIVLLKNLLNQVKILK